jgi:hypothetical protein
VATLKPAVSTTVAKERAACNRWRAVDALAASIVVKVLLVRLGIRRRCDRDIPGQRCISLLCTTVFISDISPGVRRCPLAIINANVKKRVRWFWSMAVGLQDAWQVGSSFCVS